MAQVLDQIVAMVQVDPSGKRIENQDVKACFVVDNEMVAGSWD